MTLTQCDNGCLACSSKNTCLLCDTTKQYALMGSKCSKSVQPDCLLTTQNGNCALCPSNFYIDSNTKKCMSVPATKLTTGCSAYASSQACEQCTGNFYLQNGKCAVVNATISNCQNYANNGVCGQCGKGFVLSGDFLSCVAAPSEKNCLQYTMIKCGVCSKGFVLNANLYFAQMDTPVGLNNALTRSVFPLTGVWLPLRVCQSSVVPNCLVLVSAKECKECDRGYYLSSGNCVLNPLPTITGCSVYSSLTRCTVCQSGLYLSSNSCLPILPIPNCQNYDGSASKSTCSQCASGFYLSNNQCVSRVTSKSIPNCSLVSPSADVCLTCNGGFSLTSDSLACLTQINNCQVHSASTVLSSSLNCLLCAEGFYSDATQSNCVAGSVPNCQIYQVSSNDCVLCKNQFYLSSGGCVAHLQITNCLVYHPSSAHTCSICSLGSYPFTYSTLCVSSTVVSNCVAYNSEGNQCTKCDSNYYLVGGVCAVIPTSFSNCLTFTGTVCSRCVRDFMVNTVNNAMTCTKPLSYVNSTSNSPCFEMESLGASVVPTWSSTISMTQSPLRCVTCANGMYPYTPNSVEAVCVANAELALYQGFVSRPNCFRYGPNYAVVATIVCMECASGFYLSGYQALAHKSTATTCVSSCAFTNANSNVLVLDDALGFVNICVPFSLTGVFVNPGRCSVMTRTATDNIGSANTNDGLLPFYSSDFTCLKPAPESTAVPQNYFVYGQTLDADSYFSYEAVSLATPATVSVSFTSAYSSTVDGGSPTPTVFNFRGLLRQITSSAVAPRVLYTRFNNLSFCDVMWELGSNGVFGTPFDGGNSVFPYRPALRYQATFYTTCLRCQFGYQATFTSSGSIANNPPFPSCQPMTTCASNSLVFGGLPLYLNSVLSCHSCLQMSGVQTFPTIAMDVDGVGTAQGTNKPGTYISFTVRGVYAADGLSVSTPNGFSCAVPLTPLVVNDNADTATATQPTVSNCAVFGRLFIVTAYASPNEETVLATPTTPASGNTLFNMAETGNTSGAFASPTDSPPVRFNFCLGCAGNYYPVYLLNANDPPLGLSNAYSSNNKFPSYAVVSCQASANCDSTKTTQFNSCAACRTDQESNSTPLFYAFHDFSLTNCFLSATPNCLILNSVAFSSVSTGNACMICKSGFNLNDDFQCEKLSVPNMSSARTVSFNPVGFSSVFFVNNVLQSVISAVGIVVLRVHYLLSHSSLQYGCRACVNGHTLLSVSQWAPTLCVTSSYTLNYPRAYPPTTVFVANCQRYNLTMNGNRYVCGGCKSGFVPTIDGGLCVSNSGMTNCLFAQSGLNSGLCYKCSSDFVNVNGLCVVPRIANCARFANDQFSFSSPSSVQCSLCVSGFVLTADSSSCQSGKILNCDLYVQGNDAQCASCKAGFALLILTSTHYCYPISSSLNCVALKDGSNEDGVTSAKLVCLGCSFSKTQVFGVREWTVSSSGGQVQSLCMSFNAVPNCVSYDQNKTAITANTFTCLKCAGGFFLSTTSNTCVSRRTTTTNCAVFSETEDLCLSCSSGNFLSPNGLSCSPFPTGLQYCLQYSGPSTCVLCAAPAFLNGGVCTLSTAIPNCQVYAGNNTCSSCVEDFFLANSTSCVKSVASKCLTYSSTSACATCSPKFGLQNSNGVLNCVPVDVPNCANSTSEFPFACLECQSGFFVGGNGNCVAVRVSIQGCRVYDSDSSCQSCMRGFLLSVDRTACNSTGLAAFMDPNCEDQSLMASPSCVVCELGFYFEGGRCVACVNMTASSGCATCDPRDQAKCLFCLSNFFMNASGVCLRGNESVLSPPRNNTNTTSGVDLVNTFVALILLFSLSD